MNEGRDGHEQAGTGPLEAPLVAPRETSLETSLLFDVFALDQAVGRFLAEAMAGGPLSPGEYATYSAIFELEAGTPTELAARLGMRLTTFVDQLRSIERRGHARRLPNPRDRRSYRVTLTAAGLDAHRGANRLFEAAHAQFLAMLGHDAGLARAGIEVARRAAERARENGPGTVVEPARGLAVSPTRSGGRAG